MHKTINSIPVLTAAAAVEHILGHIFGCLFVQVTCKRRPNPTPSLTLAQALTLANGVTLRVASPCDLGDMKIMCGPPKKATHSMKNVSRTLAVSWTHVSSK